MGNEISYFKLREMAVTVGLKAAAKLREAFLLDPSSHATLNESETIREDIMSENYIVEQLKALGFKGKVVTEESDVIHLGDSDVIAVIDPLDGSINYTLGIPWFSVSIAFALRKAKEPATLKDIVAGAIVPVLFPIPISFCKGKGIYIGDLSYRGFETGPLTNTIVVAFYGEDPEALRIYEGIHRYLVKNYGKVKARSLGSVALDLAYISLRKFDILVDARAGLRNVDIAAGFGLLNEVGGVMVDLDGKEINTSLERLSPVTSVIASWSSEYVEKIVDIIKKEVR